MNGRIVLEQRENHVPNVVRLFLIFAPFFSKCRALDEKRRVRTSTRMSTNPCARKGGLGYTRTRSAWFRRSQEKRSRAGFFHFFPVVFVSDRLFFARLCLRPSLSSAIFVFDVCIFDRLLSAVFFRPSFVQPNYNVICPSSWPAGPV